MTHITIICKSTLVGQGWRQVTLVVLPQGGLAVVAEEVRKLANGSKRYLEEVRQATHQIDEEVLQAVETSELGKEETSGSIVQIRNAVDVFEQLFTQISESTANIQQIYSLSQTANQEGEQITYSYTITY